MMAHPTTLSLSVFIYIYIHTYTYIYYLLHIYLPTYLPSYLATDYRSTDLPAYPFTAQGPLSREPTPTALDRGPDAIA